MTTDLDRPCEPLSGHRPVSHSEVTSMDVPPHPPRKIGYSQGLADDESTTVRELLVRNDCDPIYVDAVDAGVRPPLPARDTGLAALRPDDLLVVPALDHLASTLSDLVAVLGTLAEHGADVLVLDRDIDTRTSAGRALLDALPVYSDFSRGCVRRNSRRGVRSAQLSGHRVGRPPAMDREKIALARTMLSRPEYSVSSVARALSISRSTLYKYLPELGP
jgi:DNA invertase Pin-like site-specific DNA recombinase